MIFGAGFTFFKAVALKYEFAVVFGDQCFFAVSGAEGAGTQVLKFDYAGEWCAFLFGDFSGEYAAGVEGTHGELGSWFPDRLSCNNADRFSHVYHF